MAIELRLVLNVGIRPGIGVTGPWVV